MSLMMRKCAACSELKALELFPASTGKSIKFGLNHNSYCKSCNAARSREWRKQHPGYRTTGKVIALPKEDRIWMSAVRSRLTSTKVNCKNRKKPEPLVSADFLYELLTKQSRLCALTGAQLAVTRDTPLTLSLDQIDPGKGYVEGNVQWVAWCVNRAKGDLTMDDFYDMCSSILEYRKVQRLSKGGL